ncbi:hypothetical protein LSH36_256g04074 [Paralvinella palmiformis]|uniref:Ig-like domain-containing protein n=1 Tax=Paralvinella palmiformis TaxID=53620 RepID=A0AAD9JML0_9ANNE|nr:hypothetical protein LSH36_256g04074 [Paralvinella palmiformis]
MSGSRSVSGEEGGYIRLVLFFVNNNNIVDDDDDDDDDDDGDDGGGSSSNNLIISQVYAQNPEITERILPDIKRIGVTGKLHCSVINQMDNPVYWIHKNTQTTISSNDKIVIDDSLNTVVNGWPKFQVERTYDGETIIYSIIVNRLEPRDAGWYTCQIHVRGSDERPSKDGEMVVLIPPAIILSMTSHTVIVKEFETVNLSCDATGFPTPNITWVRVNGAANPNGELRHIARIMPIENAQPNHKGLYRCLADNNVAPPAYHDTVVIVMHRPTSIAIQSSYGQAENRMFDVTIECRIGGYPEPDLYWYQVTDSGSWRQITNDDKHTINILLNHAALLKPHERWFQMIIRSVQANDFGDYICEGRNEYGNGHAVVNLFATSECQGPNCPPEQVLASASGLLTSYIIMSVSLTVAMMKY